MLECHVELDLPVLASNIQAIQTGLSRGSEIIFVVKASAYGHGYDGVISTAVEAGIRWFAVVNRREALTVRRLAPNAGILMLGVADPDDVRTLAQNKITPVVLSYEHAESLAAAAASQGVEIECHWKVDTGMGRLGTLPAQACMDAPQMAVLQGLRLTGLMSHFASVEPHKPELAGGQVQLFREVAGRVEAILGRPLMKHISSSRAFQFYPEWDLDAVRPGILLYGYGCREPGMRVRTHPWLQWKARLVQVRSVPADTPVGYYSSFRTRQQTDLGIVCLGYADGFLRSLSNRGYVLVDGHRRPVVGRVSMNWIAVDLGPESRVKAGEEVVLLGRQGGQEIWADEMARWAGTIAYEILTSIHPNHERRLGACRR